MQLYNTIIQYSYIIDEIDTKKFTIIEPVEDI